MLQPMSCSTIAICLRCISSHKTTACQIQLEFQAKTTAKSTLWICIYVMLQTELMAVLYTHTHTPHSLYSQMKLLCCTASALQCLKLSPHAYVSKCQPTHTAGSPSHSGRSFKKTQQNTTLDNAQPQQHYTDWKEFDSF